MKLDPRFVGPYKIISKFNPVAYKLSLSKDAKIHDTFHVSMLKPVLGITDKILKKMVP